MQITDAKLHHLTAAAPRAIKTSFGTMASRHAIFLELTAETDNRTFTGWGESWINFPTWAPEERKAAFRQAYIPYLLNRKIDDIQTFMAEMSKAFAGPATQANTTGALIASLCAIELAYFDLYARSRNLPLSKLWNKNAVSEVEIYASGINAPLPLDDIDDMLAVGVKLFKLKLGFGQDQDITNLAALEKHLKGRAQIALDVNRGWTLQQALEWLPRLKDHNIRWLEEPLRPDEEQNYQSLRDRSPIPLATGENSWVCPGTTAAISPLVDIVQPDITKNCSPSTAAILMTSGLGDRMIPHYLGSAIGQAASLQLAAGCQLALCEWDINPNPLRTHIFTEPFTIKDGKVKLPTTPGLGWTPNPDAFRAYHSI